MPSGVKITDSVVGSGLPAEQKSQVLVHVRGTLNRGDVFLDTHREGRPLRIELGKRDCIAGLRYGIVGMRVGGCRKLIVSSHLGYGDEGLPERVPPNAVLRFEVELLEVRASGLTKPEDYPPGRHLYLFSPGEMKRNQPRIQFGMEEDGRCGVSMTVSPQSGCTWRHAKTRSVEHHLKPDDVAALFCEIEMLPRKHPDACLSNESLWADSSEKANSVTRDSQTNTRCITIGILDRGVWLCYFSMREDEPVLLQSKLYGLVKSFVDQTIAASSP